MKHLKKLGSVLLALVMVMALAAPAFAANTADVTVSTDSKGHTFTAFPIFTANATEKADGIKLETVEWYKTVNGTKVYEVLNGIDANAFPKPLTETVIETDSEGNEAETEKEVDIDSPKGAKMVAELIKAKWGDDSSRLHETKVKEFASALVAADKADNGTILGTGVQITPEVPQSLPTGYCLIVDAVGATTDEMLWTIYGDTTVTPKKGETKVEKTVWNPVVKDPTSEAGWVNGAVYSDTQAGATLNEDGTVKNFGGDNVIKFKIKVDIPDDIGNYGPDGDKEYYNITLSDKQGEGLTFVKLDSIILYSNDGKTIRQDIMNTNNRHTLKTGDEAGENTFVIEIPDVQTLTNIQGRDYIEIIYSAKFNEDTVTGAPGNSNEVTLTVNGKEESNDKAKVFRIELDIDKKNSKGEMLDGVKFTLTGPDNYSATAETANGGKLVFAGLAAGEYTLTEVEALPGYNKIDPMTVKIEANASDDDDPQLVVKVSNEQFTVDGGNVKTEIINRQGSLLPETGGIGTTIFYIVGGVLVVGAVVLLITKRRTSVDDE